MSELTRENIEAELQKDLEELEGRKMGKKAKKTSIKKEVKEVKKKEVKKELKPVEETKEMKTEPREEKVRDNTMDTSSDDETRSTKVFYGGIAVIVILFLALLLGGKYLAPGNTPAATTYNGYEFTKDEIHWNFDWVKDNTIYSIPLRFHPKDTEEVPVKGVLDPKFNKLSPIYITFDPVSNKSNFSFLALGAGELSFSIAQALEKQVTPACTIDDGSPGCQKNPPVSCETSEGKAVIFIKTEGPTGIYIQDTCIVVQGEGMELLRAIDRLLYQWYGVLV